MTYLKNSLFLVLCAGFTSCQSTIKESETSAKGGSFVHAEPSSGKKSRASTKTKSADLVSKKTSAKSTGDIALSKVKVLHDVKTTAYTHSEKDHIKHGSSNAVDSKLKFGEVRSAAGDWSVYPVGTKFRIQGEPFVYVVDDYGSALVGTRTLDLYKPTVASVNKWGVRKVNIDVIEWGSYNRSLAILKSRDSKGRGAVHRMVTRLLGLDGKNAVASAN